MKTKNSILLALVLTLISTASIAQINIGLRQGVLASTFSDKGDLCDNQNVTFSYTAGAFLSVPVSKSLAIQPEINYVRKGRNNETSELATTNETDFLLHYLQVPVLLQYRDDQMLNNPKYIFYVNAGPYAAFALNNQIRPSNSVQATDSKNTDWGATIGIGFQTPVCNKDIRFDLRYDMGLSKIANQPSDYRTKGLSLTIGIIL